MAASFRGRRMPASSLPHRGAGVALLMALAACGGTREDGASPSNTVENALEAVRPAPPEPAPAPPVVALDSALQVGEGVDKKLLRFGEARREDTRAALAFMGKYAASKAIDECPAGPIEFDTYDDGLELSFDEGKLSGWWLREGAKSISTPSGIHPGSPVADLGARDIRDESIGKLVSVDGATAALDEGGKQVEAIWSGLFCIFD